MFAALNIDRNNISNAVSDNMLDDIGITRVDYVSPASLLEKKSFLTRFRTLAKPSHVSGFLLPNYPRN